MQPIIRKKLRRKPTKSSVLKDITVGEWVPKWYGTYKELTHAITTRQVQWTYINIHIIPHIGHFTVAEFTRTNAQDFFNLLRTSGNRSKLKHNDTAGKPLSAWTVKKIRALLVAAFEDAIKEKIIKENVIKQTDGINVKALTVAFFTARQEDIFITGTVRHRFHLAYEILFNSGIRRSEVLGLTWDNVDLDRGSIQIRNVLVCVNGVPSFQNYPKSKASVRTIPLAADIVKKLKRHKRKQAIEASIHPSWHNKYNLVFTNRDGSPHNPNYFLHNFKSALHKLGLPRNLRIHSTRHTFATNLLQLGTALKDVQELGGWSDTRVLLEIYSHAEKATHRHAIDKLYKRPKSDKQNTTTKRKSKR